MKNEEWSEIKSRESSVRNLSSVFCPLYSVLCILLSAFCLCVISGCQNANNGPLLAEQVVQLTEEKSQLARQVEQNKSENEQLKKRVKVLTSLPEEVKLENLSQLKAIKIGGYTDLYDKNEDSKFETLIVHIQPIDEEGDKIKAAGAVDVQLWDLNKTDGQALLGQWHVEPDELRKHWVTFLVINYRLTFDVADKIEDFTEPLTVKVTFTDYLTGRVFKEQKVIKPQSS